MKTLLAFLLFTTTPALAADLTVSVGSVSETWTLSATDQGKFETWVKDAYKCAPQPDCTPLTLVQSEALWAQATLQGTLDNVSRFDKIQKATEAVADTPPITPMKAKVKTK